MKRMKTYETTERTERKFRFSPLAGLQLAGTTEDKGAGVRVQRKIAS